jgi:hypothetical protein
MLKKNKKDLKKSQAQEFSNISVIANLVNDKEFSIGEVSLHLMREVVIR